MHDEKILDSYELVDGNAGPLDDYSEAVFETWLRVGLEGYLIEGKGSQAFPEVAGTIVAEDHLILGLRKAYSALPTAGRGRFRCALAKVLASLEPTPPNVPLFEHLLSLAAILPCPEVLRVLPSRVGNDFFGHTADPHDGSLFSQTLLAVADLAAPREEATTCLHALIGSRFFDHAYAGVALLALCKADDQGLVEHMQRLREPLAKMFQEFELDHNITQQLALGVLDRVGLPALVRSLTALKYDDRPSPSGPSDNWLIIGLLSGPHAPLLKEPEGVCYRFARAEKNTIWERLPERNLNDNEYYAFIMNNWELMVILRTIGNHSIYVEDTGIASLLDARGFYAAHPPLPTQLS